MAEINRLSLKNDANLQGYWRFENDWTDESSNGYDLTPINTPTFENGKFGKAGKFTSSSSEYATISNASSPNIDITGSQTWSVWIKPSVLSGGYSVLGIRGSGGGNFKGLWINSGTKTFNFTLSGLSTSNSIASDSQVDDDIFYHVAGVYDSVNFKLKIFINGVKLETTASGTTAAITSGFSVGRLGDQASSYVDGAVDDLAIFNRALTDAEILKIYKDGSNFFMWL